jgi:simple sugar transport system permease protein
MKRNQIGLYAFAVVVAVIITAFISYRVFGGPGTDDLIGAITSTPDYLSILFVNALAGISVALFIVQLKWGALRVLLTVALALVLGYLVTVAFNLDTANRYIQGEFRVTLLSDAEPIENNDADLEYGRTRGDNFNQRSARNPVTEASYTFEGRQGDVVTILAYVANRRSTVDLQVALLGPDGSQLAFETSTTPEQLEIYREQDVRSETDAVIENFTLPADGLYTIYTTPEPLEISTILGEAVGATNRAYDAFLFGALGRVNRWAVWIQDALSLIIVGLAIAVVFRARQFSLGAEGQLYLGALISGIVVLALGSSLPPLVMIPVALVAAMTAGFLWGMIPGILKAYLGANELVATLMLNTIAIRFYEFVLTFQLKPPQEGYIASENFAPSGQLPVIVQGTQVTIAVFLVIAAVLAVWFLVTRTPLGYEIRMVGANLKFAAYGGINTRRTIMLSMAVSGIIAGLAGAHLSMGIHRQLLLNISLGLAFEGVVVALLARNNPLVIPFTGMLYAYLRAGAQFMERDANVSFEVVRIIQAVIILLITAEALVTFFQNRRQMRKAAESHLPAPQAAPAAES